jgi:protein SCO1
MPLIKNRSRSTFNRRRISFVATATLLLLCISPQVRAQLTADPAQSASSSPFIFKQVRFDQRLGEYVPLNLQFTDEHGQQVVLGQFFNNGPVILTLAYYRCPMLCTQMLNGLVRTLRQLDSEIGKDYQVVTVSIDPSDTTALAGSKHEMYSVRYGRSGADTGWHFLIGKEPEIRKLADAVGFHYAYDPASQQFAHASGIVILTPQGVVSQYTYGVSFPERDIRLGLLRASQKQVGSIVDQVLLYCYHYDPQTGKYGLVISRALTLSGLLTVVLMGSGLFILFRKENYGLQK